METKFEELEDVTVYDCERHLSEKFNEILQHYAGQRFCPKIVAYRMRLKGSGVGVSEVRSPTLSYFTSSEILVGGFALTQGYISQNDLISEAKLRGWIKQLIQFSKTKIKQK